MKKYIFGEEKHLKKLGLKEKVLLRLRLEREATATITRIYPTNTGAPAFHHKAAVFKQGKLLLLIADQEANKV